MIPRFDIDVVMPCAGSGEFFEDALDSLLKQTFLPRSIYIVDNCSNSKVYKEVVSKKKIDLIKFIELPKRLSMTENWQFCLSIGESPYFAFLHDDDIWSSNYLEDVVNKFQNTNCSIVLSAHCFFETSIGVESIPPENLHKVTERFLFYCKLSNDIRNFILSSTNACHMSALVFRRASVGFPLNSRYMPDQFFLASHLGIGNISLVSSVNSFIRLSATNVTSSMIKKGVVSIETIQHLRGVIEFYVRNRNIHAFEVFEVLKPFHFASINRFKQACFSWPLNPVLLKFGAALIKQQSSLERNKFSDIILLFKSLIWVVSCIGADIKYYLRDTKK